MRAVLSALRLALDAQREALSEWADKSGASAIKRFRLDGLDDG
jgi:hypothetical protein